MTVKERDPLTGHLTTGHEWNGITELNTRVPRIVWIFIAVTHIWALAMWILLPTWPLANGYTRGVLGVTQKDRVNAAIVAGNAERANWAARIDALPAGAILADPLLMARVNGAGHQLFGDNCAACHGSKAAGGPGFPSLVDDAWLWGGSEAAIMETLRVGINSPHPETRVSQMPAFGKGDLLTETQIAAVIPYVQSLSSAARPKMEAEGATVFAENCASCHGANGKGNIEIGAPNLTDNFWIYGGDTASIKRTLWNGRQGWMPNWNERLTPTERKILTVYIMGQHQGGIS